MATFKNQILSYWKDDWKNKIAIAAVVTCAAGAIYIGLWKLYEKQKDTKKDTGSPKTNTVPAEDMKSKVETMKQELEKTSTSPSKKSEEDTPLGKAEAAKLQGNTLFKAGKYAEAIKCYSEALDVCPPEHSHQRSTFYANRAAAYEKLKNFKEVVDNCTEAVKLNNKYVKALSRRANACEQLGELTQSLEDVTAVCILEGFQKQDTLVAADRVLKELGKTKAKVALKDRKPSMPSQQYIRSYFATFTQDPIKKCFLEPTSADQAQKTKVEDTVTLSEEAKLDADEGSDHQTKEVEKLDADEGSDHDTKEVEKLDADKESNHLATEVEKLDVDEESDHQTKEVEKLDADEESDHQTKEVEKLDADEELDHQATEVDSGVKMDEVIDGEKSETILQKAETISEEVAKMNGDVETQENHIPENSTFKTAVEKLRNESYEEIIPLCNVEIDQSPASEYRLHAMLLRATIYCLTGQTDAAFADLNALLKAKDLDKKIKVNALIKRGGLHIQREQQTEGLADFAMAARIDQDNSDIYHHRGHQNIQLDRLEDAIRDFENSISKNPDFPASYIQKSYAEHRRAAVEQSTMKLEKAIRSYETTLKRFPDCADGHALYAQALCDLGRFDDADKEFETAIEQEPDNANTYVHRALLKLQWKQSIDESIALVKKAIEIDAKCEYAYEILGTIEVQRGDMVQSVDLFNKAISLCRTETEMAHLFSLLHAAQAQLKAAQTLGIPLPAHFSPMS